MDLKVEKSTLSNGIRVLLVEDRAAPILAYQSWFKVGSRHEKPGITGISHLFEHMMFKGTPENPGKSFDQFIEKNGGHTNAYTTRDSTVYETSIHSDHLELVVKLESDRLQNLVIDENNLKVEKNVVRSERRYRVENSPTGKLLENIWTWAYPKTHPYHWPVIGWPEDMDRISVKDCLDYYKKHYNPSNLTLILVGDFDSKKAMRLIRKHYEKIPKLKVETPVADDSVKDIEAVKHVMKGRITAPWVTFTFRIPGIGHKTSLVGDFLSMHLSGSETSPLQERLVQKEQIVQAVFAEALAGEIGGLYLVVAQLKPTPSSELNRTIQKVEKILWEEIGLVKEGKIDELELRKVKNQIFSGMVYGIKTNEGVAKLLGLNEVYLGDYRKLFTDLPRYEKISAKDLKQYASRWLRKDGALTVHYLPEGK